MSIEEFRGLNNVTDAMRLDMRWLAQADNVDVSNTGGLSKRKGYTPYLAGSAFTAHTTQDFQRMYAVDGGSLKAVTGPGAANTLRTGLVAATMYWTETNDQVFFNNGTDSGVILPDNSVLPWAWPTPSAPVLRAVTGQLGAGLYRACCTYTLADGRETGASDTVELVLTPGHGLQITGIPQVTGLTTNLYLAPADSTVFQYAGSPTASATVWNAPSDSLGADLLNPFLDPLPAGCSVVQFWGGRMYAAQYLPQSDQTVVWFSQPLGYHLFDLNQDFILVPGQVEMLAWHDTALVIGTNLAVHAYDGKSLQLLAGYGVVPGQHWSVDDQRTLFWTQRGLCAALPFKNLTEGYVSVAPGVSAGGSVLFSGGQKRYLVALKQGGAAFNSNS